MSTLTPEQADAVRRRLEQRSPPSVRIRKSQHPRPGDRIELPENTRRLPGGLRSRMEAPTVPGPPPKPTPSTPRPRSESRRVLRNEDGVIVGVRPAKSGPDIVGRISLPTPKVVVTPQRQPSSGGGRVSAKKKKLLRLLQNKKKCACRPRRRGPPANHTAQMRQEKKRVRIDEAISVSQLAQQLSQKSSNVVRTLWQLGLRRATLNTSLDVDTAGLVAAEFGYTVENVSFQEEELLGSGSGSDSQSAAEADGPRRPPVVTVLGHVDHGKTTLLDHIRDTQVAQTEAGGITQHIGATTVQTPSGDIVFLDTPGHEAFSAMRTRGARVTDIVVLVVAADDGVMPTTIEAIEAARQAQTPIIVAITKMDRSDANPGRVKQMLMQYGLIGEEFGGDTILCEVSAFTGEGIDGLLEVLALQAEVMDLRAIHDGRASGTVIEARVDKGRGIVATVLVERGTLRKADMAVADEFCGKVRSLSSCRGTRVTEATPGTPVEIIGLDGVPAPGDRFDVVDNERAAKQLVGHRRDRRRRKQSAQSVPRGLERFERSKTPTLEVVVCADARGSAEVVAQVIEGLSTPKVRAEVIAANVGGISENDVKLAAATGAIIVGFNVRPVGKAAARAHEAQVSLCLFDVLYRLSEAITERMEDLLQPVRREHLLGQAEVRALFPIPRVGVVAGCRVVKGKVTRHSHVRVRRGSQIVFHGHIGSLRKVKEDVSEVGEGHECGIVVHDFSDVQPQDVLEAFEVEMTRASLHP